MPSAAAALRGGDHHHRPVDGGAQQFDDQPGAPLHREGSRDHGGELDLDRQRQPDRADDHAAAGGGTGRHRGLSHRLPFGLVALLAGLDRLRAGAIALLADRRAHLQGLGGAAIMAIQPALVRSIYPRAALGRGLGFNTTVVATSLAAGPCLGAALLAITNWPILFAVYIPLGVLSFFLAGRFLPVTTHAKRPFDVLSAVLSGVTFGLLIFGIDGVGHNHPVLVIVAELVGAAVFGTLFVWRQSTLADPMMPIDMFARPIFSLSISASTCTFTAQGLAFVSLPFFFHTVLGRDATDTGLLLTAWPLALAGVAPIAGRLADRHHAGVLGAIGLTCMAAGMMLTALLPPDPFGLRHHVAAGAVRRGLRDLRLAQQPADDERRAARPQRQRRRHHRLGAHAGPDDGRRAGGVGVRPVRLFRRRCRRCRPRRDLAGRRLCRRGPGDREPQAAALGCSCFFF